MSLQSIPSSKSSEYNKMGLLEVFFMSIYVLNTCKYKPYFSYTHHIVRYKALQDLNFRQLQLKKIPIVLNNRNRRIDLKYLR